jgi:Leucine-rich repeat (LRR) protein
MTGLKILNVNLNVIEKIPRNTFPKLFELHTMDISYNRVRDIWNFMFKTLFSLRFLNMSHNSLRTIKGSTFGALHTLLELDLSHNELSDVNKAALVRCASLRRLTLHNNSLTEIFQLPISLSHLDLSHNATSNIPPLETWPTMNSLLSLDLSYNIVGDSLERGAFSNLLTLQRLNFDGNGIMKVPWESLSELYTLQFFNMQVRWYLGSPTGHLLVSGQ